MQTILRITSTLSSAAEGLRQNYVVQRRLSHDRKYLTVMYPLINQAISDLEDVSRIFVENVVKYANGLESIIDLRDKIIAATEGAVANFEVANTIYNTINVDNSSKYISLNEECIRSVRSLISELEDCEDFPSLIRSEADAFP